MQGMNQGAQLQNPFLPYVPGEGGKVEARTGCRRSQQVITPHWEALPALRCARPPAGFCPHQPVVWDTPSF